MEQILKREVRLYELVAGSERLYRLSYPNRWLVPVEISQDEEFAVFEYDLSELEPLENLRKRPLTDRLRLLVNIAGLEALTEQYNFSLSPENLYVDRNLEPLVLMRDLISEEGRHDFLEGYKALAGTLIAPKYDFADYLEGGSGLLKKNDKLAKLLSAETVGEVRELLRKQYESESEKIRTQKITIDRRQKRFLQVAAPVCFVLFILSAAAAAYMHFVMLPHSNALLQANREFLRENFDMAIDLLHPIDPMSMEREERFQLARAYVIAESLTPAQRAHILSDITLMTDDNLLLFWIAIGRLQHYEAIDIAMRLGDDELLLFALVKYEVAVQLDATRPGQERMDLIAQLNRQIETLQRSLDERREAVEEDLAAQEAELAALEESEQEDEDDEDEDESLEEETPEEEGDA